MVNSIEVEVFRHALLSVAGEMGIVLRKTSYSANIKERRDYSCAVYDASGQTLAMGDHMPVHLGAMPMSVKYALEDFTLRPGDVVVLNDPFRGGTHLPDITAVRAVFCSNKRKPDFYVANRAHHADVGGMTPGSMPLAREIYQEGLRISPILLVKGGQIDRPLLRFILSNVRTPSEREGDLLAQLMSLERGNARLQTVYERWGKTAVTLLGAGLLDYSERVMRSEIASLPNGQYVFEDFLDNDGFSETPVRIRAVIKIKDEQAIVDFTGSAPQTEGSINANFAITTAAVVYVFRSLIRDDVPFTAGLLRPLKIIAPSGTVVNADAPAAMAAGNAETSQRITDVVLGALAQAVPERISAASAGTMTNLTFGGYDRRRRSRFAYYETIAGGMGASAHADGLPATHTHMTNSWNSPIEALEQIYPVQIRAYRIRKGSGGRGKHSGGAGIIREYEFLEGATAALLSDRQRFRPYGLSGGEPGEAARATLISKKRVRSLPAKCQFDVQAGDVLRIETPGGGGYGKPK